MTAITGAFRLILNSVAGNINSKLKTLALAAGLGLASPTMADIDDEGTRSVLPSASHIMIEVGERYQNLYWAAKLGQWQFAEYQVEELEKQIELLKAVRPKFAPSAEIFLDHAFEDYGTAFAEQSWTRFERAFDNMRGQCIACHGRNDHGFIVPPRQPVTAPSPILNLPR